MAEGSSVASSNMQRTATELDDGSSATVTITEEEAANQQLQPDSSPTLRLRLQAGTASAEQEQEPGRVVKWAEGVVDNEHMGKKKSKCCCVYQRPRRQVFGDDASSGDESDQGECHHCTGHGPRDYRGPDGGSGRADAGKPPPAADASDAAPTAPGPQAPPQ